MLRAICEEIDRELRTRPEYAHTSHFLVTVDGRVVYDAHYRGRRSPTSSRHEVRGRHPRRQDGWAWRGRQLVDPTFAREMPTRQSGDGPPEGCAYGYLMRVDEHGFFAGGWAGQHVTVVPAARAVVVTTGDPRFDPGPPPTSELPPAGARPATW